MHAWPGCPVDRLDAMSCLPLPLPSLSSSLQQQPQATTAQQVKLRRIYGHRDPPRPINHRLGIYEHGSSPHFLVPVAADAAERRRRATDRPPWGGLRAATARASRRGRGRPRRTSCSSTTSRPTDPATGACSPSSRVRALSAPRSSPPGRLVHA